MASWILFVATMETPPPLPEKPPQRQKWYDPVWLPLWLVPSILTALLVAVPVSMSKSVDGSAVGFFCQFILFTSPFYLYAISVVFLKRGPKPEQAYGMAVLYAVILIVINAILSFGIFFAGCLCAFRR